MAEFRFNVGDVILTKAGIEECRLAAKARDLRHPIPFTITQRVMVECYAGAQANYTVGTVDGHRQLNDVEVVALADYDIVEVLALYDAATEVADQAHQERWEKRHPARKNKPE